MGIKPTIPYSAIKNAIEERVERQKRVLIRNLAVIGEETVNKARNLPLPPRDIYWDSAKGERKSNIASHTPSYIDWTSNLRSSIGYIIVVDGQVATMSDFKPVGGQKGSGAEGSAEGKDYAHKIASEYPSGIVLIVVAGMKYASYVQRRGYDVTASAELLADQLLKQLDIPATLKHI